jgi:hypothetical protein
MYVLLMLVLLQPVMSDDAATTGKQAAKQQPTQRHSGADLHRISIAGTPDNQHKAEQHQTPPDSDGYAVQIKKQPPPEDTPLFRWYLLTTAIGVAVNAFIWIAILKQTKLNSVIAEGAKKSAIAAEHSASALVNAERAWLMVDVANVPGYPFGYTQGNSHADITLICRNDGGTPCWINEVRAGLAIIDRSADLPPDVESGTAIQFTGPMPVGVGKESEPIQFHLDIEDSPDLGQHVVIYGVVKYRHPFAENLVTTTFAYASEGGPWHHRYGQPKYNNHT